MLHISSSFLHMGLVLYKCNYYVICEELVLCENFTVLAQFGCCFYIYHQPKYPEVLKAKE